MKKLVILSAALLLVGAGCGSSTSSTGNPPPEPPASATSTPPVVKQEPADIRVTAIKAITNQTGEITDAGCDGPQVDLVLTVTNLGADFPPDEGLAKWKTMIDARKGEFGAVSSDETPVFTVEANAEFAGKTVGYETGTAVVLQKDLQGGKLKNGQTMDLKTHVAIPCCDQVGKFTVSAAVRPGSAMFMPPGEKGIKEPYKDDFELHMADITPGHGQFVRLGDGRMGMKVSVDNLGNAPTAGPVKVQVSLARKGSGFSAADWEMQIDEPFTGSAEIIAPTASDVTGEPDYSKVSIGVYPLCPSKTYDIIRDANPQNDHVVRQASAP